MYQMHTFSLLRDFFDTKLFLTIFSIFETLNLHFPFDCVFYHSLQKFKSIDSLYLIFKF